MLREKKLVLVSHCVLNQNSVVKPLARANGPFSFVNDIVDKGIGIIQLPCPEFKFLSPNRKPMTKEEYDCEEYRSLCREIFKPIFDDLKKYLSHGYKLIGLIGINHSPTCSITNKRGIFMEEIFRILSQNGIEIDFIEVPTDYDCNSSNTEFLKALNEFLL